MKGIVKIVLLDILKSKFILFYTLLLLLLSWGSLALEEHPDKALLMILSIILLTIPLVSILFSMVYVYNSGEFIGLLLSQPLKRKDIWLGLFFGIAFMLVLSFLVGCGIPLLAYAPNKTGLMMALTGSIVSLIFISLAFLCVAAVRDKTKGIGMAIITWLCFTVLFDGLVLFLSFQFSNYPIETPMVFVVAMNPVDLARVGILLNLDQAAMMGYTGAVFKDFFGTTTGLAVSFLLLLFWVVVPLLLSLRLFKRNDL